MSIIYFKKNVSPKLIFAFCLWCFSVIISNCFILWNISRFPLWGEKRKRKNTLPAAQVDNEAHTHLTTPTLHPPLRILCFISWFLLLTIWATCFFLFQCFTFLLWCFNSPLKSEPMKTYALSLNPDESRTPGPRACTPRLLVTFLPCASCLTL